MNHDLRAVTVALAALLAAAGAAHANLLLNGSFEEGAFVAGCLALCLHLLRQGSVAAALSGGADI